MTVGSREMFIDPMSKQVVECMLTLITAIIINIFHMAKCILKEDKVLSLYVLKIHFSLIKYKLKA